MRNSNGIVKNFKSILTCIILIGIIAISCVGGSNSETNEKERKTEQTDLQSPGEVKKSIESFDVPVFSKTSTRQDFKNGTEKLVNEIEKSLDGVKPLEKKLTIFNHQNTPVKIWFSENSRQPIKIEQGEAKDSGEYTGLSSYYFIDGDLWYSGQPFAQYIFESEKLMYWLDENWNINQIPEEDLKSREEVLNENVALMLNE